MSIRRNDPKVAIAGDYLAQRRHTRRPQFKFNLRTLPYQIQPFMCAPVIPGESFQSMMLQSQTWSHPLKADMRNIGWWLQYNFFYVRHRDFDPAVRTMLAEMLLNPEADISSLQSPANAKTYNYAGGIDWAALCLEHVVANYFRDEGEADDVAEIGGLPISQIYGRGTSDAIERLTLETDYEDRRQNLIDEEGKLYINDLSTMWGHWAAMRDAGLTEMDYEDFMRTYGSTVRQDEDSPNLHRAEDLWSLREFTYPTNTVEPSTGVPAVAAGWRVQKSGGKRIFCDEPGFIFGVQYTRPKVYMRNQKGAVANMMQSVKNWLPAVLHDQPDLGHVFHEETTGPLAGVFPEGEGYWLDIRDLLLYGDQFVNYDPTTQVPFMNLPKADGQRRYAAEADVTAMFTTAGGYFETDGIASLSILGRQRAQSPNLVLGRS